MYQWITETAQGNHHSNSTYYTITDSLVFNVYADAKYVQDTLLTFIPLITNYDKECNARAKTVQSNCTRTYHLYSISTKNEYSVLICGAFV